VKRIGFLLLAVATLVGAVAYMPHASGQSDGDASPIYGVKIPAGYRDWKMIAVAQLLVPGKTDQLRAQLGRLFASSRIGLVRRVTRNPCYSQRKTLAESAVQTKNTRASAATSPKCADHRSPCQIPPSRETA
jgi:hypothetical protein